MVTSAPAKAVRKIECARFEPLALSAFRTLGLPATASQSEVFEAASALRLGLQLGVEKRFDGDLAWLAPTRRAESDVRDALGRLADPPRRAAERLFWFHGDSKAPRPASLAGLRRDADALAAGGGPAARHDAALLLLAALHALDPQFNEPAAWADAFRLWREEVGREEFWSLLVAADLKGEFEQALTFGEAAALRAETPRLVSKAVADAAVRAAVGEDYALAGRALAVLRAAALPPPLLDEYENETLGPVEERADDLCGAALLWARLFARDAAVLPSARKRYFDQSLHKFDREVRPELLKFLEAAGPHSFHLRRALRHAAGMLVELAGHYREEGWADQAVHVYGAARALAPPGAAEAAEAEEGLRAMGAGAELNERAEEEYAAGLAAELRARRPPAKLFESDVETRAKHGGPFHGCFLYAVLYAVMIVFVFGLHFLGVIDLKRSSSSRPGFSNFNSFNFNYRVPLPQFSPVPLPRLMPYHPEVPTLTVAELRRKMGRRRVVVVDVRAREAFAAGHIAGALNLPGDEAEGRFDSLRRRGRQVVVYGASSEELLSRGVAFGLRLRGLANVAVLEGGFEAWVAAGLPAEADATTVPAAPPRAAPGRVPTPDVTPPPAPPGPAPTAP